MSGNQEDEQQEQQEQQDEQQTPLLGTAEGTPTCKPKYFGYGVLGLGFFYICLLLWSSATQDGVVTVTGEEKGNILQVQASVACPPGQELTFQCGARDTMAGILFYDAHVRCNGYNTTQELDPTFAMPQWLKQLEEKNNFTGLEQCDPSSKLKLIVQGLSKDTGPGLWQFPIVLVPDQAGNADDGATRNLPLGGITTEEIYLHATDTPTPGMGG